MATITIRRGHALVHALRAYAVLVDGVRLGTLRQGETFRCDVGTGRHEVRLTVDWCGSPTLVVDVGTADVDLACAPHRDLSWLALPMLFRPDRWIDLRPADGPPRP